MFACRSESKPVVSASLDTGRAAIDFDGDGYPSDEDCDDNTPQSMRAPLKSVMV